MNKDLKKLYAGMNKDNIKVVIIITVIIIQTTVIIIIIIIIIIKIAMITIIK